MTDTLTIELSSREARALHNIGALFASALEEKGCDLLDCEPPEGEEPRVAALVTGVMALELALAMAGERVE